ncbi:MAG: NUDIX hydrolase [Cyclobacteriaceae bacterium]|nr:NUDIX hydrolase [Cyclobacteriaceae bacterium]
MQKQLHPNISVDCVIFGFDFEKLNVLLVERTYLHPETKEVIFSDYTLAGNHVYVDENLVDAAKRVLNNLTGLDNIYLEQFYAPEDPGRLLKKNDQLWLKKEGKNPEERVVSVCYFSLLNCKEVSIQKKDRNVDWHPISEIRNLGFDHDIILAQALKSLQVKLQNEPIGYEMLPLKFTLSQLQKLYEVVFDMEFDKRNFRKKVSKMKYLIQLDEKQKGVSHKPARYYIFSRDVYEKTKSDILNFSV